MVKSVLNSLSTDKLKKENAIITNVCDLDGLPISVELRGAIKAALDNRISIDQLKSRIHIPILLLHECATTATTKQLSAAYKAQIAAFHKERADAYFAKQLEKSGSVTQYNDIHFHIILFPVPSKQKIVDAFINAVVFYKEQDRLYKDEP